MENSLNNSNGSSFNGISGSIDVMGLFAKWATEFLSLYITSVLNSSHGFNYAAKPLRDPQGHLIRFGTTSVNIKVTVCSSF